LADGIIFLGAFEAQSRASKGNFNACTDAQANAPKRSLLVLFACKNAEFSDIGHAETPQIFSEGTVCTS
jgi:hypothetical protein